MGPSCCCKAKENIDASTIPKSNDGGTYVNITENMLGNLKQAPVMMYNSKNTWNDAIIWREISMDHLICI